MNTALIPAPLSIEATGGSLYVAASTRIESEREEFAFWADWLESELARLTPDAGTRASAGVRLRHDPALGAEAYRLDIGDEVRLTAATPAGMGHAAHTLAQLAAANPVPGGTA
ncbi:MAG TPA: glycoside hydrolase family 20 zincin-like fold domain-containing protein, partial [Woeseiaceae bacterium]|nr:glycoside hydrolase family 20 zincin-like fold domain-containing protein [Woeseiaceae bacterium]